MKRIAIVGAGGFAREVALLISEINRVSPQFEFLGFLPADASHLGRNDSRDHILGDLNWLEGNHEVDALAMGIGSPERKLKVAHEVDSAFPNLEWPALIHPTVRFDQSTCKVERGVILCADTVGTVNLIFEEFCMVNLVCTIGHEARIGRYSVINPTANVSGGVTIGDGALIGVGASILQYLSVGAGATVGAGSVVVRNVEPYTTVFGNPASVVCHKTGGRFAAGVSTLPSGSQPAPQPLIQCLQH